MIERHAILAIAACALAAASPLAAQGWSSVTINRTPTVTGNGQVVTQQRAVGDFRSVSLQGAGDLVVRVGPRPSLSVTADSNILPLLVERRRGDQLILETRQSYRSRHRPRFVLTVPALDALGIAGSGDARVDGIASRKMELAIGGSGRIVARGRTDQLTLTIGGSGDIDARGLSARAVAVTIGGSGNAQVATNGPLTGAIAGSGSVRYLGRPSQVAVTRVGSGRVEPLR
jgi:hypothetical protein